MKEKTKVPAQVPVQSEEPIVGPFVTMCRVKGGSWATIKIYVQGSRVVERELVCEDVKLIAQEQLKLVVAREIFRSKN